MRSIIAAVSIMLLTLVLALSAGPTSAQRMEDKQKKDDSEATQRAKERKSTESGYKSAIERLPDQKYDPWRNLR